VLDCVVHNDAVDTMEIHVATHLYQRYHEMPEEAFSGITKRNAHVHATSYSQATVVRQSPSWFTPRDHLNHAMKEGKFCAVTCCATPVAISLSQGDRQIISTTDGPDLADVLVQHYKVDASLSYFATTLTPDLVPCLQPGVIIHIDNHGKDVRYFFDHLRKNISVPFVLITSRSDADSPEFPTYALQRDDQLIKWFGQSPELAHVSVATKGSKREREEELRRVRDKLVPFPLGLSYYHPQLVYLKRYLGLRNYSNPFRTREQKQRWIDWAESLSRRGTPLDALTEVRDVLFVKYGFNRLSDRVRETVFTILCNTEGNTYRPLEALSCTKKQSSIHETYKAASRYLFGLSLPGAGWDCYRTYELLLLGVIPVILGRRHGTHGLFDGLPVVELPYGEDYSTYGADDYLQLLQDYVTSKAFLESDFDGWNRLFFNYWRRRLLSDAGRDKQVMKDEHGAEYYVAWQYTPRQPRVLCSEEGNCGE